MQIVRGKRQVVLWASIAIVAVLAWIVFVEVNKSPYNTSRDGFEIGRASCRERV